MIKNRRREREEKKEGDTDLGREKNMIEGERDMERERQGLRDR